MSLTGLPLLVLLSALVVAALAGTLRWWRALAAAGWRAGAARLAVLAGCQVLLCLTVLAAVNRHFAFYASWGELPLIATADGGGRVDRQEGGAGATSRIVARPPDASVGGTPEQNGELRTVDVQGARSGLHAHGYVYLPPQYFAVSARHRRFPVTIVLSGYPGAVRNLVTQVKVPATVLAETRAGRVPPMIYMMLRPVVGQERDTECNDVPGGPQVATFFAQDLPEALRGAYRTAPERAGWGLFGISTGGYCSLKLAMRHSDVFAAAASLSGYYGAIKDLTTGELYGGSQAVRDESDLFWRLEHLPSPPVSVLVTTSEQGERNKEGTLRFLSLVKPPMRATSIVLDSGGHNFQTWERVLPGVLRWMGARLRAT
ncbi:alpha/beta hydrolase [Actinomadura parmotrematis]|uniref:Esterase n=1 Tax=Actinomadura parmotrematis TaxID=2864039 RepID=A0ABS7FXZ1_9ACTN|nr:alpha/beta hydrolase-fold protein [Actinomadura parmotrematis]MBW8485309.1 hypothetical protein [Actinomadura parmotrematis]